MEGKVYSDTEICLKCVDEDEVLYDEKRENLTKASSAKLTFTDNPEIFKNMEKCQEVMVMCIKQRVLLNEPVVRFHHKKDVADLQAKISEIGLSKESFEAIRDASYTGYKVLKDYGDLDILVEFDAERLANVVAFGKTVKMAGFFHMLAMVDELGLKTRVKVKDKKGQQEKSRSKPKLKKSHSSCKMSSSDSNFEDVDSEDLEEEKTVSEATISSKNIGRAAVTVVFTARKQVPAMEIYRQLLFSHLHTLSTFHILVFHVGPLVDRQEVVLYEYKIPKQLQKLLKINKQNDTKVEQRHEEKQENKNEVEEFQVSLTVKKSETLGTSTARIIYTDIGLLDINLLETEFRQFYGRQLQQLSPFKDYFRYLVYDCPGIKDHRKDNKERYERYLAKKEQKKVKKKKEKEIKEQENPCETARSDVFGSVIGEAATTPRNVSIM